MSLPGRRIAIGIFPSPYRRVTGRKRKRRNNQPIGNLRQKTCGPFWWFLRPHRVASLSNSKTENGAENGNWQAAKNGSGRKRAANGKRRTERGEPHAGWDRTEATG
eukprot:Pompholyxophrys_punicea_v1_NODE_612_length_1597_cov_2.242542.p4 type:complete len:106 gc:universal NODE_612_length_1597_cov_2.242542:1006-689(-)